MRARARPRPRTPGSGTRPASAKIFCGGEGRFSARPPGHLGEVLVDNPTFPPPRTAGRNTSRMPPGSHGASSGLGQDPRMACSCQECGVDVSSDSSEPPIGVSPQAPGRTTPRNRPSSARGRVGVGSGRPCPTDGRNAQLRRRPRGPAPRDRGRQRAGIGRRSICTVPGASTRIARRRSSARNAPAPRARPVLPRGQTRIPKGEVESLRQALTEALEQQTATAEILRVISSSPTDVQPVFAAVLTSAARLCDASDATIFQVDGDGLRLVASRGPDPLELLSARFPLIPGTAAGRAVLDRRTIHVADLQAEVGRIPREQRRSRGPTVSGQCCNVPLLREGRGHRGDLPSGGPRSGRSPTGRSSSCRPSPPRRSSRSRTSACSTRRKRRSSSRRPRAEILRVIASSPTDLQPVLRRRRRERRPAVRGDDAAIFRVDGELHPRWWRVTAAAAPVAGRSAMHPPISRGHRRRHARCSTGGRSTSRTSQADAERSSRDAASRSATARASGPCWRRPLLREGVPIGAICISADARSSPFTDKQIALLETFADQAVIAIENVRLFRRRRNES